MRHIRSKDGIEQGGYHHRLRPIDTHLALYTMLYNTSVKNRYAEPVRYKNKENIVNQGLICPLFSDKRKIYLNKRTLYTFVTASNLNYAY